MRFSEKLIRQRELCGMTQQSLADAAGISRRSVASYEASGVIPRRSTIRRIAKVLGVSSEYLSCDEIVNPLFGTEKARPHGRAEDQHDIPFLSRSQEKPLAVRFSGSQK